MVSGRRASRVFFPWEEQRGIMAAFERGRLRVLLLAGLALASVVLLYEHEERRAAVRSTRATLTSVARGVAAYRADRSGACPRSLGELVALGYVHLDPVDAWGRPLNLECPGRRDPLGFDLSSDGADGLRGGLDRVE